MRRQMPNSDQGVICLLRELQHRICDQTGRIFMILPQAYRVKRFRIGQTSPGQRVTLRPSWSA